MAWNLPPLVTLSQLSKMSSTTARRCLSELYWDAGISSSIPRILLPPASSIEHIGRDEKSSSYILLFSESLLISSIDFAFTFIKQTFSLKSFSLKVNTLYGWKPRTFPSLIPSAILYRWSSLPNKVAVVLFFFSFSN